MKPKPSRVASVADVRTTGHRVVVVDDGSKDNTADLAAGAGAIVIRHPINLGDISMFQCVECHPKQ